MYCAAVLYSTLPYSTLLYSTVLYSIVLYCTLLYYYCTLLYSTLLYPTLLYSTGCSVRHLAAPHYTEQQISALHSSACPEQVLHQSIGRDAIV